MPSKGRFLTFCCSRRGVILLLVGALLAWWLTCLPRPLFSLPLATEVLDRNGVLLSAKIAADGQWRMPVPDTISPRLGVCVTTFEDRRFYRHWGVDPVAILRALRQNYRAGAVVSGGSTLTMQVARMARGNRARTLVQKILEAAVALRLEVSYSKREILDLWLNHAPFGGNVIGVEAACRRYYGRSPADLSWAEAATLAVLPNSPALIHPGRDRAALLAKRNRLLDRLHADGLMDAEARDLARLEPLPASPYPMPREAPHLLERLRRERGDGRFRSALDADLQRQVNRTVAEYAGRTAGNQIHNAAVLVGEVATGRVVAYVGNVPGLSGAHAPDVDLVTAPRSPGSVLKPVLYALSLQDGSLLPRQLLRDVPTSFGAFRPANFHRAFAGAVAADRALAQSLNVPFVYQLRDYGTARFHAALRDFGFGQMGRPTDHYGLSLILGGAEITLEEIHGWFLGLARQQRFYYDRQGQYAAGDFHRPGLLAAEGRPVAAALQRRPPGIGAGAGYATLTALRALERPDERGHSTRFASHRPVAWKTGTSFGFRDAWAVGTTPAYTVGVWVGNADGEGRDGLVGVRAAAPLLFRVLRLLDARSAGQPRWFEPPYDDLRQLDLCRRSGLLAGADCPVSAEWVPAAGERGTVCSYHPLFILDPESGLRVALECNDGRSVVRRAAFVLPSRQAHFYRRHHPDYREAPAWHPDCRERATVAQPLQLIYPEGRGVLSPARNWRGETEPLHFEVAHADPAQTVYWHLNGAYLGATRDFHSLAVTAGPGRHRLVLTDGGSGRLVYPFTVR